MDSDGARRFPNPFVLYSAIVMCADGKRGGRVRDIYIDDDTGYLAAVTVVMGRLRQVEVLVPALALAGDEPDGDGVLRLIIDKEALAIGLAPPVTGHATIAELREAADALGLDPAEVPDPKGPTGALRALAETDLED